MKTKNSKKLAFTVAEILLAVTILGIIFLLSVNTLQNSSADRERSSQLMKLYPIMDNMINLVVLENMSVDNIPFGESDVNGDKFSQMLVKRLRVGEDCQNTVATTCWTDVSGMPAGVDIDTSFYRLKLVDGTGLAIKTYENCGERLEVPLDPDDAAKKKTFSNVCMVMYADVNSFDRPNEWEKDVFKFVYDKEEGFQPASEETIRIIEKPKESVK